MRAKKWSEHSGFSLTYAREPWKDFGFYDYVTGLSLRIRSVHSSRKWLLFAVHVAAAH
jgi:hypothetical protein